MGTLRDGFGRKWRAVVRQLLFLSISQSVNLFITSCGVGDDDGQRFGDVIVGTWQRGWGEGDVVIDTNPGDSIGWEPGDFSYDLFVFRGDGTYNGMVREGTFTSIDEFGDVINEGNYRCDNNNLKLTFTDSQGNRQSLLAQILLFTESTLKIQYVNEDPDVTVTMTLRKTTDYSSSTSSE